MGVIAMPFSVPVAAVGVDTTGDGFANRTVAGLDLNEDGIPDVLQGPYGPFPLRPPPDHLVLRRLSDRFLPPPPPAVPLGNLLAADKSKDGVIDRAEYMDAVRTGKLPGGARYAAPFPPYREPYVPYRNLRAADKNKDGVIDAAEYVDAVRTGKLPAAPYAAPFPPYAEPYVPYRNLRAADKNKDGVIDAA